MNFRENLHYFIIFGVVFLFLYIFVAIKSLTGEFNFKPEATVNLTEKTSATEQGNQQFYPFRLEKWAGFLNQNGEVVLCKNISSKTEENQSLKATLTNSYWSIYTNNSEEIEVLNTKGEKHTTLNASGFPFFQDDRLYVLAPGGNAISEYTPIGSKKWSYEGFTPITAFNSSSKGSVLGFANGELVHLTNDGAKKFSMYPGGSEYEVIFGADIAESKNYVATLCGLNRQRFVLISYEDNQQKVIFHEYLKTNLRSQSFVQFTQDSNFVYFQYKGGLGIVDCTNLTSTHLALDGTIIQLKEMPSYNLTIILSQKGDKYTIHFLEDSNKLVATTSFNAKSAFISVIGKDLFLGKDNKISKIAISRD